MMKKLIRKYGHIWLMSYFMIYLPWFFSLQKNIGKPYHVVHAALDDLIPFCEYFIVPYLFWFLSTGLAIAYFFFTSREDYYRLCTFLFIGMTVCLLICTLYPNGTDFRPVIDPDKNVCSRLVSAVWRIDPCINVFPSIHVYNAIGVHIAVCHSERLKKNRGVIAVSAVVMTLICLSTVFLKQHSVLDGFGSVLLAFLIYPLVYAPEEARRKRFAREPYQV